MALRIVEKAARTDVGRQRQSNEDSYLERSPLFAVADGMGGARAGEVASRVAVEAFDDSVPDAASPEERLAETARAANRQIYRMAQENSAHRGMGTTFTAALVTDREVAIGHVGDSRVYRLRDGELERLTHDHSLVEELVRQGKLTPEEAEVHPQRSIITRALGPEPEVEVDTYTHRGRAGDVYLICSDGLTGMVSEDEVATVIERADSLEDAAKQLIAEANSNGGKDNITVVLFRLEEDGGEEEHGDTLSGDETQAGISAAEVRAAVEEREGRKAGGQEGGKAGEQEGGKAGGQEGRIATAAPPRDLEGGIPTTSPIAARRPVRARRRRAYVTAALVLLALGAVVVGLYVGTRQFWFVGTERGQVTLFRGLPYDLPLGVSLYSRQYVSSVPAAAIGNRRQRSHDLDQTLRSHGDAVDLVRSIERTYSPSR